MVNDKVPLTHICVESDSNVICLIGDKLLAITQEVSIRLDIPTITVVFGFNSLKMTVNYADTTVQNICLFQSDRLYTVRFGIISLYIWEQLLIILPTEPHPTIIYFCEECFYGFLGNKSRSESCVSLCITLLCSFHFVDLLMV